MIDNIRLISKIKEEIRMWESLKNEAIEQRSHSRAMYCEGAKRGLEASLSLIDIYGGNRR